MTSPAFCFFVSLFVLLFCAFTRPEMWQALVAARAERDALRAEVERMREALLTARHPCAVAASYVDDKSIAIGLKLHAESCVAALRVIDAALASEAKGER